MSGTHRVPLAATALALLAAAGCGVGSEAQPQPLPRASLAVAPPTGTPRPPAVRTVPVYLVDAESRLRRVEVAGRAGPDVSTTLDALLQVGTTLTAPTGLRSLVPRGTKLRRVVVYPSDLLVDLDPQFLTLTGQDQVLATAQIVLTATERRPDSLVRLSVEGRRIPVPVRDGSLRTEPVRRADYAELAEPSPPPGS